MFGLKRIFARDGLAEALPERARAVLEAWRQQPPASLDDLHFHTRYVVVDISLGGHDPERDAVLGIAAVGIHHGLVSSDDACYVDLAGDDPAVFAEQLAAFLAYIGHDPLVTFHEAFVVRALQRLFKDHLGLAFEAAWIDMAWLLPAMFEERCDSVAPLDVWLGAFALEVSGERRDAMANTLLLAKVFQLLLVRAVAREVDTAARLIEEFKASQHLRRNY